MKPHPIAAEHLRISAANDGKWFTLDFEKYLAALYGSLLHPGMIAVDCGANTGLHTMQIAMAVHPGGLVVAVEPVAGLLARLGKEIRDRQLPDCLFRLLQCAISRQSGQAEFYSIDDPVQHGLSGLRLRHYPPGIVVTPSVIEVITLDEICHDLPRLDFLKLDIEGAEFDALRGGTAALRRFRPVIALEQTQSDPQYFGYAWEDLLAFFRAIGYRMYDLFGLEYTQVEHLEGCLVWDFAAIPDDYPATRHLFAAVRECMIASGVKGLGEDRCAESITAVSAKFEGRLVRKPGSRPEDQKVYYVQNGCKRWVTTSEWITGNGMQWPSDVRIIAAEDLDAMATGLPLP